MPEPTVFGLNNKRAVVTGGASGIGVAIARLFVNQGADVVVLDLDAIKSEAAAGAMGATGVGCDASRMWQASTAHLQRYWPPDR